MADLGNRYHYLANMEILDQEVTKHLRYPKPFFFLARYVAEEVMVEHYAELGVRVGADIKGHNFKDEGYTLVEDFGDCLEQYWLGYTTREVFRDDLYAFKNDIITHFKIMIPR
tara:strand:+ start:1245 stop:1583 length:339 start_codon:yes stop_codon:yes gene_type:complete